VCKWGEPGREPSESEEMSSLGSSGGRVPRVSRKVVGRWWVDVLSRCVVELIFWRFDGRTLVSVGEGECAPR
jgi:hypothetical protein